MDDFGGLLSNDSSGVVLKSGKRIMLRKKNGAHHMIENRLLSMCIPRGDSADYGVNIGDMVAVADIRAVVTIESIDGASKSVPESLSDVIELMSEFVYDNEYDEWSEFKRLIAPANDKIEGMAKNLQAKVGLEAESASL